MTTSAKIWIGGISALALAAIPAALALGATGWLGFTITAHGFQRSISQESRRAAYVSASEPPKAQMKIEAPNAGPVIVDRAEIDGDTLTVYLRNRSHQRQCYQQVHWALRAPDGAQIAADDEFIGDAGGGLEPGDRAEGVVNVKEDRRAASIRLLVSSQDACG